MNEFNKLIPQAKDYYIKLSNLLSEHNVDSNIKIIENKDLKNISKKLYEVYSSNFSSILSVYSYENRIEITNNFSKEIDVIELSQEMKLKEYLILKGMVKIRFEYLSIHKINITYEIVNNKILFKESNSYDVYSSKFNHKSKTIRKTQAIEIFKDSNKFIDFLLDDKSIETLVICFRCEYIPREREIWTFEKRKKIANLLRKKPQEQYTKYIHMIVLPHLGKIAKEIIQKYPEAYFLRLEEVESILYYIVLDTSLKNKKAIYLFEYMENEEEFKSFLFSILQTQVDKNYFMNQFKKISKIDLVEDIDSNYEYINPFLDGPEKEVIDQVMLEEIYTCLLKEAINEIQNINRRDVIITFLELAYKGEEYSIRDVHRIFFPEMNLNTFYAHRHYGFKIIINKCKKYYNLWR